MIKDKKPVTEDKSKRVTLWLPLSLLRRMKISAAHEGMRDSEFMREALLAKIGEEEGNR